MASRTYVADDYADIARRLREISGEDEVVRKVDPKHLTSGTATAPKEPDLSYDEGYFPYCGFAISTVATGTSAPVKVVTHNPVTDRWLSELNRAVPNRGYYDLGGSPPANELNREVAGPSTCYTMPEFFEWLDDRVQQETK